MNRIDGKQPAASVDRPAASGKKPGSSGKKTKKKLKQKYYEKELARLQVELSKFQEWVVDQGRKVVVVFEGRDAAGKGGTISRITTRLNHRVCRVASLAKPTDREQSQWYFQRYVAHLPSAGEIVLFDRSWYNRAGVDRVMGFCTEEEYREFLRTCPQFERMLVRSGIRLIKYWFSVSAKEQERRFRNRIKDPLKSWKFSDMDLQSYMKWDEYSHAKDEMMTYTDIKQSPWYVVPSDSKRRARLNCITHLLSLFPYDKDPPKSKISLPGRDTDSGYVRPPMDDQRFIPELY